jgi:hypothetical protein
MQRLCRHCHKEEIHHTLMVSYCLVDEKYDHQYGPGGSVYEPMDNLEYLEYMYVQSNTKR